LAALISTLQRRDRGLFRLARFLGVFVRFFPLYENVATLGAQIVDTLHQAFFDALGVRDIGAAQFKGVGRASRFFLGRSFQTFRQSRHGGQGE
jgi:hypothetical protein